MTTLLRSNRRTLKQLLGRLSDQILKPFLIDKATLRIFIFLPPHEKKSSFIASHIAHICLCLPPQQTDPKAKPKESNRQRFINSLQIPNTCKLPDHQRVVTKQTPLWRKKGNWYLRFRRVLKQLFSKELLNWLKKVRRKALLTASPLDNWEYSLTKNPIWQCSGIKARNTTPNCTEKTFILVVATPKRTKSKLPNGY